MRHVLPLIQAAHDLHSVALVTVSGCRDGPSRVAIATARHARRGNLIESCNRRRHWGTVMEGRKEIRRLRAIEAGKTREKGGGRRGRGRRRKGRRMRRGGWTLLLNDDRVDPGGFRSRRLSLSRPYSQLNVIGFPVAPSDAPFARCR